MAETVGLAFSGVALISLFSTCLEMVDYIDNGKSYFTDAPIAATKVELLRTRFKQWGEDMNIMNADHVEESAWSPDENKIIVDSLEGIKKVIETALRFTGKHKISPSLQHGRLLFDDKRNYTPGNSPITTTWIQYTSVIKNLMKRTTWAVLDKRKLNSSISELEFLIENLEVVSRHHRQNRPLPLDNEGISSTAPGAHFPLLSAVDISFWS